MAEFVDEVQINVRGGDGGAGSVSFRREAHVPRGGPDGGDGGKGGDVVLEADRNVASLLAFQDHPHRKADSGKHGSGARRHGASGKDLVVSVPVGTVVKDRDGSLLADRNVASLLAFQDHPHRKADSGKHGSGARRHGASGKDLVVSVPVGTVVKDRDGSLLADLVNPGDRFVAAEGGRGGRGNAAFQSNRRRAPGFAEQGEYGEEQWLRLELKLMADAALVGFPNAGKSTLISVISAAKPKIADYPFTTLVPNLGVVRFGEHEFVVADIPGVIEGAAEGRGLGHQFLRHVERARVLVILLDLASVEGRTPAAQEEVLLAELGRYRPELLERPRLVVGSRADVADPELALDFEGLRVSAVTRDGLDELLGRMAQIIGEARAAEPEPESFVVLRPAGEGFAVERDDDGTFRVVGRPAERAVAMADLTNEEALAYMHQRLRKLGVDRALRRAGVRPGDVVRIGEVEMEYVPDGVGETGDQQGRG